MQKKVIESKSIYENRPGYDENKTLSGSNQNNTVSSEILSLLEEFPEYNAGYNFEITNVGAIFFSTGAQPEEWICYDLLNSDSNNTTLDDVSPDTSILEHYTHISNPFDYRVINFNNGKLIPNRIIKYNNQTYIKLFADYILVSNTNGSESWIKEPNDKGWFVLEQDQVLSKIYFYYKQSYKIDGKIDGVSHSDIVVSNFKNVDDFCIPDDLPDSIPLGSESTGYLEVR